MKTLALYLFLNLLFLKLGAQNAIGLPEIVNFTKYEYRGGAQSRQVAQDRNGIMFYANNEGVLTYNGARWKIFPLPNNSIVRCLKFAADGKLYVGGQDEFGYFSVSETGVLKYQSLKHLVPKKYASFTDVWEISFTENSIFFQTSERIFQLTGSNILVHEDPHWLFMGKLDKQVVAQSSSRGLLKLNNEKWVPLFNKSTVLPNNYFATSLISIGADTALLTTLKNGLFLIMEDRIQRMQSPLIDQLQTKNISSSVMVNNDEIAIGTNLDGCFIIDKKGNLVSRFGIQEGLQDNSILSVFLDREKNLWLGLHNGIDFVPYNNSIKHIRTSFTNEGAGFSSQIYKGELYIGTSIGAFKVSIGGVEDLSNIKNAFTPIKESKGEAWNLSEVNEKLLMGHNDGAFVIDGGKAVDFEKTQGYWNFQSFTNNPQEDLMVAGTYTGVQFFQKINNVYKLLASAETESARFVVVHKNRVWFSHPYKGVYGVQLKSNEADVKKYTAKEGITSNNNNYLFNIKNKLVLTTENGVFEYDEGKDRFVPDVFYNKHLPPIPIRYLKEDTQGNVWFVFEKKIGVLNLSTNKPYTIYFPELTNKFVAGFEHINPVDKNNILIGGEKGFYNINYEQYKKIKYPLEVRLTSVTAIAKQDSLLFAGYGESGNKNGRHFLLGHQFNSYHFEYSCAVYGKTANIEYSYRLKGFEETWSEFSKKTEKDYTNLSPGTYTFEVKARNNLGNESLPSEYIFTVLPPWYKTTFAKILYILFAACIAILMYRYQKRKFKAQQARHEEEQKKLQYLHQLEMEKTEKELIQLRNEKLEAEIINKNNELASASMHLVQKTDVLLKIKEQMIKLKDTPVSEKEDNLKKILRTLNNENTVEEQWQHFSIHFDAVHNNFLSMLKKNYPVLSPNDHKLCAYLKMNLTTKEIAQLMNISVRGVEISRYRLRKKLQVPAGSQLFSFLESVS